MLTEEASSFRHQARLAISLSWIAGYTNAIVLIVSGQTISHQTGNITHLGKALGEWLGAAAGATGGGDGIGSGARGADLTLFALIIASFGCGALCSGILIGLSHQIGRLSRYVLPMGLETVLLSLLVILLMLTRRPITSTGAMYATTGLSAFAMGLQNATITRISGSVVRTTHLTGVFTDLGLESAQVLLRWCGLTDAAGDVKRIALLAGIVASFLSGAILGTLLFSRVGPGVLLLPVGFLLALVLSAVRTGRRGRGTVMPPPS